MDFHHMSAHHLPRDAQPWGPLPPLRSQSTPSVVPANRRITRNLAGSRRKRSTDQTCLTAQSTLNYQENKRVLHHRSDSNAIESNCVQSTKPNGPTIPLNTSSAGAAKKISKVKLFPTSPTNISTSGKTQKVKGLHKSRAKKAVAKGSSPSLPNTPSPILNVAHTNVPPKSAAYTTPYLSIYELDDLSRWDMDSIPSIPSPPTSPGNNAAVTLSLPTLFSSRIYEDELLENDIPFPLSRQPKVLEHMGVKKSKNKVRTNVETTLTRRATLPRDNPQPAPSHQPQEQSTLPGLPHPLPLRTLRLNSETSQAACSVPPLASTRSSPSPQPSSGPSVSKKDAWGCMHLGAADCELSIVFPSTAHYEVWDMGDDTHIACPVLLCIMAKDAYAWSGMPLALPDVTRIDLQCEDLPLSSRLSIYDPNDEYTTHYNDTKTGTTKDDLNTTVETKMGHEGITIDGKWIRTYSKPGVEGSGRARVELKGPTSCRDIHAQRHHYDAAAVAMGSAYARGWYLKAWIPIPTRLFMKRETRVFNLNARVFMMGDEERVLSLDGNEDGMAYPLLADAHMTVSHLRSRREMDGCWW